MHFCCLFFPDNLESNRLEEMGDGKVSFQMIEFAFKNVDLSFQLFSAKLRSNRPASTSNGFC